MADFENALKIIDAAIKANKTLVVVGKCRVKYFGRAASKLAEGDRLVIVKSDGSFLVHQNKKMAAINYQPPGGLVSVSIGDGCLVLKAERKKPREFLEVAFSTIDFANAFEMKDDESLRVFGTERELSALLMDDLERIESGLIPIKDESATARGYIDVFARDKQGNIVLVEVKRRTATLDAVSQLHRYVHEVAKRRGEKVRGILAAPSISPNALTFLEREGMSFAKLDFEIGNPSAKIRGVQKKQKALADFCGECNEA